MMTHAKKCEKNYLHLQETCREYRRHFFEDRTCVAYARIWIVSAAVPRRLSSKQQCSVVTVILLLISYLLYPLAFWLQPPIVWDRRER